ncbi:MAG: hydroxymethylbilane synthase [Bdellovibrionales bacterium]
MAIPLQKIYGSDWHSMKKIIRIGSRGSPLALLQAKEVCARIIAKNPSLSREAEFEIVPIQTSGDWTPGQKEISFRDAGSNKELFTKEIEQALLSDTIDMAVHSMKDVASRLPNELEIAAMLDRADPRDALMLREAKSLADLPQGAVFGTSSLRRQAQILALRPDLKIVPLRGNIETRLRKLEEGKIDATMLAAASLVRLGMKEKATAIFETDAMTPAAGQGALGIEIKSGANDIRALVSSVNAPETFTCVEAERAFLRKLDGSCHTPIGAFAWYSAPDMIRLEGLAAKPDGSYVLKLEAEGPAKEAEQLGASLGETFRSKLTPSFWRSCE